MSAFEDYCIVCEKVCEDGSAYCSDTCKLLDQEHSNSPTLSVCSGLPSISGSFSLEHSKSHSASVPNTVPGSAGPASTAVSASTIPTIISPLLTPQINPRCSVVGSIKSPPLRDLTYESPLLASTASAAMQSSGTFLSDLDANRLDLNSSVSTIAERLHHSSSSAASDAAPSPASAKASKNDSSLSNVTDISNMLRSPSENYKKWLSIH
ncbi:hypothetical protein PICMEDRAFT_100613 [Pichia membranifaciens NRRL Y-2026]|uniref:Uncharacterized protein n=1 Tax=Pichia membranifaciens NRRL Y-2026 TaxID=763406 RepID=A0A1E3NT99_9ASCO|nr:hypothetical protein PICMEDRAFT_100613 [Pichia membranifaciens NRRL Y-2026]ODQ49365.1 hypothetical protein PICMEDRAFT_100613 [Pichia membranifaciens NRRL Y-2026]